MGYLDKISNYFTSKPETVKGPNKTQSGGINQPQQEPSKPVVNTPTPNVPELDKMSDLEIKAEMNKALGFVRSQEQGPNFDAIDRKFAQDPIAFANKYASPEVRENAQMSALEFDATATLLRTMPQERQNQVIEGFSQRNESPRAFTGEFLDLFSVA